MPRRFPRRIATISVHTSPLEQPGTGDAGGLNVYVVEVAKRLAARGVEVEIFTRAVSRDAPPVAELVPGVLVRHVPAGPFEDLDKADLPAQLCHFTFEVLRTEAAYAPGRYDLVHAHYWLSGQVGPRPRQRWGVPLVQSMHTLGRVKNAALAWGDAAEPEMRLRGEAEVVATADRLVANTDEEARQLIGAVRGGPGQGLDRQPGGGPLGVQARAAAEARQRLGLPAGQPVVVFAGRVQPLKAPDVVLRAAALLVRDDPALARRLTVAFVGGPSGTGRADPDGLTELARTLGIAGLVRLEPPCPQSGTRRLVPGGDRGHGAVLLGVVRPGGRGGPGMRHAGDRRLRRRAAHGRPGRRRPACWLTATTRPATRACSGDLIAAPGLRERLSRGRRRARLPVRLDGTVDRLMAVYAGAMNTTDAADRFTRALPS